MELPEETNKINNTYWTKQTDRAIIEWKKSGDNALFDSEIYPALYRLAEYNNFKFNPNSRDRGADIKDCISALFLVFSKINESKDLFYYFNVCARNYFLIKYNKTKKNSFVNYVEDTPEYLCEKSTEELNVERKFIFTGKCFERENKKIDTLLKVLNNIDEYIDPDTSGQKTGKWTYLGIIRKETGLGGNQIRRILKSVRYCPIPTQKIPTL